MRLLLKSVALVLGAAVVAAMLGPEPAGAHSRDVGVAELDGRWAAGAVRRGTGYWRVGGSDRVREVQRTLRRLGHRPGPVDGLFGPLTEAAVKRFQRRHRLERDGVVGPVTLGHLRERRARMERLAKARSRFDRSSPSREPTDRPAGTGRETPTATPSGDGESQQLRGALIALLLALGISGVAFAAWLYRRERPLEQGRRYSISHHGHVTLLDHNLWLEGRSHDPVVGHFKGFAQAMAVTDERVAATEASSVTYYLVSDVSKPKPVWVGLFEITHASFPSERPAEVGELRSRAQLLSGALTERSSVVRRRSRFTPAEPGQRPRQTATDARREEQGLSPEGGRPTEGSGRDP